MVLTNGTNVYILAKCVSAALSVCVWLPLCILGSSSLGLHSRAPEVCEDLWLAEGRHARCEGDLSPDRRGCGVPLLAPALSFLEFFCSNKEASG